MKVGLSSTSQGKFLLTIRTTDLTEFNYIVETGFNPDINDFGDISKSLFGEVFDYQCSVLGSDEYSWLKNHVSKLTFNSRKSITLNKAA